MGFPVFQHQPSAFVSTWIAPSRRNFTETPRRTCPSQPSMILQSHEKMEVLSTTDDVEVAKYKFEIDIPAKFSKDRRRQSIQSMKQHANFPGFRKGTLPPYVMNDLEGFVLRDSCNEMIEEALGELELSRIEGEEGEPEVDWDEMSKNFKIGEHFSFTCEMQTRQVLTEKDVKDMEPIVTTGVDVEKVDMFKDREEGAVPS